MTRTIVPTRTGARATVRTARAAVRTAALGTLVVALAGCGGGGSPEEGTGVEQGGGTGTSDGGTGGGGSEGTGTSDAGGASGDDGAGDDATGEDGPATAGEAPPADADLATAQLPIPAERAIEIGTEAAGGGDPGHVEIDHDDDRGWVWDLEIALDGREHDLEVDAATGEVLEQDDEDDTVEDPTVDVTDPLPYSEALELAVGEVDGRISSWDLDSDDGRIHYQVEVEPAGNGDDEVEVEVDVETGEVRVDD